MFHNKTGLYFILVSSCFFSFHTKTNKASAKNFIYIQYIYIYIYIYIQYEPFLTKLENTRFMKM